MQPLTTQRVLLYQLGSLGIYFFVWCYRLGKELTTALQRKAVPSMWWFIVPGGNLYWMWRLSESLEIATGKRIKQIETFLLYILLSGVGFGGSAYFPDLSSFSHSSSTTPSTPENINIGLAVTIALIVVGIFFLIAVILNGVYIAIIQSKLNKIRGIS